MVSYSFVLCSICSNCIVWTVEHGGSLVADGNVHTTNAFESPSPRGWEIEWYYTLKR